MALKVLVSIYSNPDLYPPTLNAIEVLCDNGYEVDLVYNNIISGSWLFPNSVKLFPSGAKSTRKDIEKKNLLVKLIRWIKFTVNVYRRVKKCDIFIAYDPIPLFSYRLVSFFIFKKPKIVWYHNHDIHELGQLNKFSIGWFSVRSEKTFFDRINIFSLPSQERKLFFPMDKFRGEYFFIPNYPSLAFYSQFNSVEDAKEIRILFQGNISPGHGIEELIELLPSRICSKHVKIVLKGHIESNYLIKLNNIAFQKNVQQFITFVGPTSYQEVPLTTQNCHIGIAIFTRSDVMNRTLGTASNKIYEYAACGLPIIYYSDEHYDTYLKKYAWAIPTDLTQESLKEAILNICMNYNKLSLMAKNDFKNQLNFENSFSSVITYINSIFHA